MGIMDADVAQFMTGSRVVNRLLVAKRVAVDAATSMMQATQMKRSNLLALALVLIVAIGTAVGAALSKPPDQFERAWVRVVYDHGQPERFGHCPLMVDVGLRKNGVLFVNWSAMGRLVNHCLPLDMAVPNRDGTADKSFISTMIASQKLRISPARAARAMAKMYRLGWQPPAKAPKRGLPLRPHSCPPLSDSQSPLDVQVFPVGAGVASHESRCFQPTEASIRDMRALLDELGLAIPADARVHPFRRLYVLQP
ncbi:hypothetical protein GV829_13115 [Sphingomonas lacunae]|uniref:Uncharacterized protein n=1 Tax=Sphingomonas lacunae TaxID=2698828 RepID=A0A6M4AY25_9SPHN|nr:hypothetical protein [Sphingomonas lacunae]QJQ33260.1 hypothetical protein GV829_13115 [Sphingomonas lacunae]